MLRPSPYLSTNEVRSPLDRLSTPDTLLYYRRQGITTLSHSLRTHTNTPSMCWDVRCLYTCGHLGEGAELHYCPKATRKYSNTQRSIHTRKSHEKALFECQCQRFEPNKTTKIDQQCLFCFRNDVIDNERANTALVKLGKTPTLAVERRKAHEDSKLVLTRTRRNSGLEVAVRDPAYDTSHGRWEGQSYVPMSLALVAPSRTTRNARQDAERYPEPQPSRPSHAYEYQAVYRRPTKLEIAKEHIRKRQEGLEWH